MDKILTAIDEMDLGQIQEAILDFAPENNTMIIKVKDLLTILDALRDVAGNLEECRRFCKI